MGEIWLMLGIFAVTSVVSYVLISGVPQRLHTPLMAFTNAISAVTILGALLVFATDVSWVEGTLGAVALVFAAFNLVGGFAITNRMTGMFRR